MCTINRVTELEAEVARLRAQITRLEADANILACAELIADRQYGLAEAIGPQPTQKQIDDAVRRAQKRARTAQRGV